MTIDTIHKDSQYYPTTNRNVKDRLFRFIFQNKTDLLDLYNAVNHSDYTNIDDLSINTLDDAIYLSMKNDISFLVGGTMNLYEHQSSFNPNMPIRGLLYFAKLYEEYINLNHIDLFRSKQQSLPAPQYIVFYNGLTEEPDCLTLKLSDSFLHNTENNSCLECTVTMLNINYGHNKELLKKCKRLEEYAIFIATIRKFYSNSIDIHQAVTLAVDECIRQNVLKDILIKHKSEVISMVLTTFDQAMYEKDIREDGYEDGFQDGFQDGLEKSLPPFISVCQKAAFTKEATLEYLIQNFSLKEEILQKYVEQYWE